MRDAGLAGTSGTFCAKGTKFTRRMRMRRQWKVCGLWRGSLRLGIPATNFRVEPVEELSFDDACADVVISNTVLHFARDDAHFDSMLRGTWRPLKPGGLFFCRLASTIGMESEFKRVQGRRFLAPDGAERYLVDAELLAAMAERIGGELAEPLKTTVVQNQRAMTTWVLEKKVASG